jgi:hypothetical protein
MPTLPITCPPRRAMTLPLNLKCYILYHAWPSARRFPPPWIFEEHAESFIVNDATGQALA